MHIFGSSNGNDGIAHFAVHLPCRGGREPRKMGEIQLCQIETTSFLCVGTGEVCKYFPDA